jgi:hypothetical protein
VCVGVACSALRASSLWRVTRAVAHTATARTAAAYGSMPGRLVTAGQEGQLPRGIRREQRGGRWGQQHTLLTHTAQVRAARQAASARVQQPVHLCMASRRRQLLRVQPASVLRTVQVWV